MASNRRARTSASSHLRILHVTQPVEAGTANVVKTLAAFDLQHGHEVSVGCPSSSLSQWTEGLGGKTVELPISRSISLGDVKAIRRFRRALEHADVVVLHSSKAGALGRLIALTLRRARRPVLLFYPHGWSWLLPGRASRFYKVIENLLAPVADKIVAVSDAEAHLGRQVLTERGAERILTLHNGVDTEAFSPEGEVAPRSEMTTIVCVGRLCQQKGQDLLIAAIHEDLLQDVRLVLVGEGPDKEALHHQALRLGVAGRVDFLGFADPRPYYRSADVVVLPSRWEGFSLVTLEAMACGANVAASVPAAADLTDDNGISLLHDLTPLGLAEELVRLLDDEVRSRKNRSIARAHVVDQWSWKLLLPRYGALITELVAQKP